MIEFVIDEIRSSLLALDSPLLSAPTPPVATPATPATTTVAATTTPSMKYSDSNAANPFSGEFRHSSY